MKNKISTVGRAAATAGLNLASGALSTLSTTTLQSMDFDKIGSGDFFNREMFMSHIGSKSTWASLVAGAASTGVSTYGSGVFGAMGAEANKFYGGAMSLATSAASTAASYGVHAAFNGGDWAGVYEAMGGISVNVASFGALADLVGSGIARSNTTGQNILGKVMDKLDGRGVMLNIGLDGVSASVGSGGIDLSGNLYDLGKRALDKRSLESYTAAHGQEKGDAAWNNYVYGDWTQENTSARLASGLDQLELVGQAGFTARTNSNGVGGRLIQLVNSGNSYNSAIALGHESYRDGIIGTAEQQGSETLAATTAHTQMALRMLDDGKAVQMTENLDITAYKLSQHLGDESIFAGYVAGNYDASADYWKLMDDGSITYDGQADLYDENGNLIYKSHARGIEGSLTEIIFGKNATPEEVKKVRQLMVESGLLHTVDKQNPTASDLWRWDLTGVVGDNALNKWFFTENVDVKEYNMGKGISLAGIRDVFASSSDSSSDAGNFIERVYAAPINLLNYVDGHRSEAVYDTGAFSQELTAQFSSVLQQSSYIESLKNKSAAAGILKMVYTDDQFSMIRENQKFYNRIITEGQNIQESMINNKARNTHDFDIVSDLLKLTTSSVKNAVFLIEEHPGFDFGRAEAGATVDSPGGYWQFLGKDPENPKDHKAAFQLYGGDLNMRIQHLNPAGIIMEKDKVYGDGTSDYKLFDYPTESHGSGTAPHIHVEFTRLLPYDNRAYVSQYVHPDTLQPGSRFKYNLNYYDKDMNLVEPRRYAQNFGRLERKECRELYW